MGIALVLLVPLALLIIAWLVRKFQPARTPNPRLGEEALAASVPTFRIVALGLRGSGKTLLLASMYQQLLVPVDRRRFYLRTPPEDAGRLREQYRIMADSATPNRWPEGTTLSETRHYGFSVCTQAEGVSHEVLRLDYLEYAGELLTDTRSVSAEDKRRLHRDIESAHALLCILDGQVILEHQRNASGAWSRLDEALSVLVENLIESRAPITFVITKWDLFDGFLEDGRTRLEAVRELLLSNDQFRNLVQLKGGTRIIRLVPVSAVGTGFAQLDKSGQVVKIHNRRARPTNVDVPLSAVVPDIFEQAEASLTEELKERLAAEYAEHLRVPPWQRVAKAIDVATRPATAAVLQAIGGPSGQVLGATAVELLFNRRSGHPAAERQAAVHHELNEADQRVLAFSRSRDLVMQDMQRRVDEFEFGLPSCRLTGLR